MARGAAARASAGARAAARICCLALLAGVAAACTPRVPYLASPTRVEAYCGSKEARATGIKSVVASTDDKLLDERPTDREIEQAVRSGDGVVAHWNAQLLALPDVAAQLGETDGYARLDAAAIPPAPEGAQVRHIYLLVADHGKKRWITMSAYDVQNVCVEGKREG